MAKGDPKLLQPGFGGMNTRAHASQIPPGSGEMVRNITLERGRLETRQGSQRLNASRPAGSDDPCRGITQFRDKQGTLHRVAVFGTTLYEWDYPFSSFTSVGSIGSVVEHVSFATDGVSLFIATGNEIYVWEPVSDELAEWMIAKPTNALSPSQNAGGGNLSAGTYQYRYTWYSSITGAETAPRAKESVSVNAGDQVDLTIPSPPGSYWDTVRVYRSNVGGSTTKFLVDQTASGTYTDGAADSTLGDDQNTASVVDLASGSEGPKYVVYHQSRLWFTGFTTENEQDRLYWSEPVNPHKVNGTSFDTVTAAEGEAVTGAVSLRTYLLVFTRRTTSRYSGVPGVDLTDMEIDGGKGCLSHWSCVEIDAILYRLTYQGIVAFSGHVEQPVSDQIYDLFTDPEKRNNERIDLGNAHLATAAHRRGGRQYLLAFPRAAASAAEPDRMLAGHYQAASDGRVSGPPRYALWGGGSGADINPRFIAEVEDDAGDPIIVWGDQYGYLYEVTGDQDGTTSSVSSGEATGGSSTTLEDSGASFPTTGDGLSRAYVTVVDSDGTIQTAQISSNTSTQITVSSWPSFTPASGDTYYVGAIDSDWIGPELALEGKGWGFEMEKRVQYVIWWWKDPGHSGPWRFGFRVDGDSSNEHESQETGLQNARVFTQNVKARLHTFQPRVRSVGTGIDLNVLGYGVEFRPVSVRG